MTVDQDYVDALIANPREWLDVEIKDWIDPRSAHGQAKIVKACLAMRNQDGSFLQVGFEDGTWRPSTARHLPARQESRQDVVQQPPVALPLDTPTFALGPFVREATSGLFAAFGGFEPGPSVTEGHADELLARGRRAS